MGMTKSDLIVRDEDILGGTRVFAGSRVPVQALADYLTHGHTLDEFLEHFPSVVKLQKQYLRRPLAN